MDIDRDRFRAVNRSKVRPPKWTGEAGELAVVVSRGEPRRSPEEMREWVGSQVQAYLAGHADEPDAGVAAATTQLVVADHVLPVGSQGVSLTREHLLRYVAATRERLTANGYFGFTPGNTDR